MSEVGVLLSGGQGESVRAKHALGASTALKPLCSRQASELAMDHRARRSSSSALRRRVPWGFDFAAPTCSSVVLWISQHQTPPLSPIK